MLSSSRANARLRIESTLDLNRLFRAIDADPAIVGAGVVYIDDRFNVVTLRDFQPICSVAVKRVILREAPRHMAPQQFARELESNPRESKIVFEAMGMALSCVGAVIAWSVIGGSTVMAPFSGGASLAITYVGVAAATATSLQCINSSLRTTFELAKPEWNDWLDSHDGYQQTSIALDAISLAGAAVSAATTIRMVNVTKAATGKSMRDVLRGLSRQERATLTDELLKIRDPGLTPKLLKLRKIAGKLPKRYTQEQIRNGTLQQIKDCIGAGLGLTGSALSGNIRALAVGMDSEFADE